VIGDVIFAENARGQTALCDILRSLFTKTPAIVIGCATLGSPNPPEMPGHGKRAIGFGNGVWTGVYSESVRFP